MADQKPDRHDEHKALLEKSKQQQAQKKALEREQKQHALDRVISDHWGGDPAAAGAAQGAQTPEPGNQGGGMPASDARVKDLKNFDGAGLLYVSTDSQLMQAIQTLAQQKVGLVLVCDPEGGLAGVLSERDVIRVIAGHGAAVLDMTIDSFITTDVATCGSNDRVADVAALMSERRIRHLPIVDAGILKGMISASDIVTFLAKSRSA